MSEDATITIAVEQQLREFAERQVALGKAPSMSAVFNQALRETYEYDLHVRGIWQSAVAAAEADAAILARVERMKSHIAAQAAKLGLETA